MSSKDDESDKHLQAGDRRYLYLELLLLLMSKIEEKLLIIDSFCSF